MDPTASRIPRALSIAGSDSGGGAGIQADLKAFAACGVHGMTALTAVTAQSTVGVVAIHPIPAEIVLEQIRAVARDIGVDAVKVGMVGDVERIDAVAQALDELPDGTPTVLDPVMVAESGARLLDAGAQRRLIEVLLPRASVITPNVPEALALLGEDPDGQVHGTAEVHRLARRLHALGPAAVLITGGHRSEANDVFFDGREPVEIAGATHPGGAAHGSGCTHSAVLAARLAWGDDLLSAAREAKRMAALAVGAGLREIGAGPGPVHVLGSVLGTRH